MPWRNASDVRRHNKAAANNPMATRAFIEVANKVLEQTGDEGRAIREANKAAAQHLRKRMGQ